MAEDEKIQLALFEQKEVQDFFNLTSQYFNKINNKIRPFFEKTNTSPQKE